jgi:drug/metabolite transporter (DMT)-like permease
MWGMAASLGRAAFTGRLLSHGSLETISPLVLAQSRTTLSFLVLFPVLLLSRGPRRLRLPKSDLWKLFVLGVLGVAASNYFYYLAIQRTNVATAIIVQYTAPIWVLLYTILRGLQRVWWQPMTAVVLAVGGVTIAVGVGSGKLELDHMGVLAALLAAVSFAFYNVGGHQILKRNDHWMVLLYTTLSAGLFWIVINPPWKIAAVHYSAAQCLFLMIFAVVSVLGPFSLYFAGLKHLEPTQAIIMSCTEPIFSIVIAAIALGELVRPLQILGILLVLAGIIVVQIRDRTEATPMVEPIE